MFRAFTKQPYNDHILPSSIGTMPITRNEVVLTADVVLLMIVGERDRMEGPGRPSLVFGLVVIVTGAVRLLAEEVHLLPPIQVPGIRNSDYLLIKRY